MASPGPARAAATLLLTLTLLVGCGGGSEEPSGDEGSASAAPAESGSPSESGSSTPAPSGKATYVALGDSYTAAPLISETVGDEGCLRSSTNYPRLVAEELGVELDDRSCTGADTTSLIGVQETVQNGLNPAQFDGLTEDTTLVTLGIGGNDFGVFGKLIGCAKFRKQDPSGAPCRAAYGPQGLAELRRNLDMLGPRLQSIVDGVRDRSPKAEIVVVGYPQIIPPDAYCPDLLPIARGDYALVAELNQRLDRVQQAAAAKAKATYVDLYDASDGHDICSEEPWINGPQTEPGVGLAFHPLAAEQQAAARMIVEAVS